MRQFLLHSVDPLIGLKQFYGLRKNQWLGVHEVLERTVSIHFVAARVSPTAGVVSDIV